MNSEERRQIMHNRRKLEKALREKQIAIEHLYDKHNGLGYLRSRASTLITSRIKPSEFALLVMSMGEEYVEAFATHITTAFSYYFAEDIDGEYYDQNIVGWAKKRASKEVRAMGLEFGQENIALTAKWIMKFEQLLNNQNAPE